jgi:predicted metalloendopeptidase
VGEIWRLKASEEYQQMLLSMDVHAPGKLRANVQASNLDEFLKHLTSNQVTACGGNRVIGLKFGNEC